MKRRDKKSKKSQSVIVKRRRRGINRWWRTSSVRRKNTRSKQYSKRMRYYTLGKRTLRNREEVLRIECKKCIDRIRKEERIKSVRIYSKKIRRRDRL
jgi:hypothetical protein